MNVLKWEIRRRWVGRKVRVSVTGSLPDIESTSVDTESRHALRRCYRIFDSLPTKERLAFVLRYMEGMTIDEVAAALAVLDQYGQTLGEPRRREGRGPGRGRPGFAQLFRR